VGLVQDQQRLDEIRRRIDKLRLVNVDNFNLPARYDALVKLEAILVARTAQTDSETSSASATHS